MLHFGLAVAEKVAVHKVSEALTKPKQQQQQQQHYNRCIW
jgi:hypothetical protein